MSSTPTIMISPGDVQIIKSKATSVEVPVSSLINTTSCLLCI